MLVQFYLRQLGIHETHQEKANQIGKHGDETKRQYAAPCRTSAPVDVDPDRCESVPAFPIISPVIIVPHRVASIRARQLYNE